MTHTLEIHDLADSGQLQLVYREGEEVRNAPPVEFRNPLEASDHQELEWFFKEYWTHPFDQSRARAEAIENALRNLGRLFLKRFSTATTRPREFSPQPRNTDWKR